MRRLERGCGCALGQLALVLAVGGCVARDPGAFGAEEDLVCEDDAAIDGLDHALAWAGRDSLRIRVESDARGCDSRLEFVASGQTRVSMEAPADGLDGRTLALDAVEAIAFITPGGPGSVADVGEVRYLHGEVALIETDEDTIVGRIDEARGRLSGCFVATICD